jgi:uncharacterized protein
LGNPFVLIAFGLCVGVICGFMGIGGGSVMIPILVIAFAMSQQQAQATSLAVMIPPLTLPAVIAYYRGGHINLRVAAWIALGILCGSYFGASFARMVKPDLLKLIFGLFLVYVAGYTVFSTLGRDHFVRSVVVGGILAVMAFGAFQLVRWQDRQAASVAATSTPAEVAVH